MGDLRVKEKEKDVSMRLKEVVAEHLNLPVEEVKDDSRFVEDLGADSLDTVELLMKLEQEFDLQIPDEDAESLRDISAVKEYIFSKI
ncbi:MAG: acyl carrier protein [Thermotogae bacterium]|nr:acyl carrier protein [Thermotogota bacterium]